MAATWKDIGIAWLGGIAPGEVGDPLEPVSALCLMNEQLSGTSFNRAATIQICAQRLG